MTTASPVARCRDAAVCRRAVRLAVLTVLAVAALAGLVLGDGTDRIAALLVLAATTARLGSGHRTRRHAAAASCPGDATVAP
jgi:hypothetical protein